MIANALFLNVNLYCPEEAKYWVDNSFISLKFHWVDTILKVLHAV
jgi:hypothetical protein